MWRGEQLFERDKGVFGQVLQSRQPFAKADYLHWSDRLSILDNYKVFCCRGRGLSCRESDYLGSIIVAGIPREERVFGDGLRKELLHRFGNHAAVALENAVAYGGLNRKPRITETD